MDPLDIIAAIAWPLWLGLLVIGGIIVEQRTGNAG